MASLSPDEILAQSRSALAQWEPRWEKQAAENAITLKRKNVPHRNLLCQGQGKQVVCVGMGASLEKSVDLLKEYQGAVDVACVDKAFGALVDRGIKPQWVFVADAGIDYDKWLAPWIDQTEGVHLVANICCEPKYPANWKGPVTFFVNKDNLHTEAKFSEIGQCYEAIPAASNVGNIVVVFLSQVVGYDRYILTGYDFSWEPYGNYYAWDWSPNKRSFMHHMDIINSDNGWAWTSSNLQFSGRWLSGFLGAVSKAGIDVVDCSGGILEWRKGKLATQLELARRAGVRKWTPREQRDYIKAYESRVALAVQDFDKIPKFLEDENMAALAVTITGAPKAVIEYARTH